METSEPLSPRNDITACAFLPVSYLLAGTTNVLGSEAFILWLPGLQRVLDSTHAVVAAPILKTGVVLTTKLALNQLSLSPLSLSFSLSLSLSLSPAEQLADIAPPFAIGFGSYVDKIAYPFASTLQDGRDYLQYHFVPRGYVICCVCIIVYIHVIV